VDPGKASTSESNSDVQAKQVTRTPAAEATQLRAYEIYVERGGIHGFDTDDWRQAELELVGSQHLRDGPNTQQASTGRNEVLL